MSESNKPNTDSAFDADRVEVPGRAAVHDKRTNPDDHEIDHYECPFCDYEASSEQQVRGHITYEDDAAHRNRNGYLDQIYVHGVDTDGNVVEDLELNGEVKSTEGTLSTELLPDDLTDKQESILSVAILNPELTIEQLTEKIADQTDYDTPTSSYVGTTVKEYLSTPERDVSGGKRKRGYDQLTDKQQAVIDRISTFENPTDLDTWPETRTKVAQEAGYTGGSVIPDLVEKYGHIAQHRKATREAQEERNGRSRASDVETTEDTSATEDTQDDTSAASTETYTIEKDRLAEYATRFAQMQEDAESQADFAPDESLMSAHAAGKLEIIESVEEFLRAVRDDNTEVAGE